MKLHAVIIYVLSLDVCVALAINKSEVDKIAKGFLPQVLKVIFLFKKFGAALLSDQKNTFHWHAYCILQGLPHF